MSIEVIKSGMADSIQDGGRFGFQYLGINPNGVMDMNAMKIANALVGNELNEAVLEMSFPASTFRFNKPALIALSGADFTVKLNGKNIPLNQPIRVASGSELKFTKAVHGAWCYLAVQGGFELNDWLGSKSTNTKANVGGVDGRSLKKGDVLSFRRKMNKTETTVFPWRANVSEFYAHNPWSVYTPWSVPKPWSVSSQTKEVSSQTKEVSSQTKEVSSQTKEVSSQTKEVPSQTIIRCIQGNEFDWLTKKSKQDFLKKEFTISRQSDRMGYRLTGTSLTQSQKQELLSTAVSFGTIQVLPNGEPIALMADHQTTGGYPRIAHVIGADRSRLVQCQPNERISFSFISVQDAEDLLLIQERSLQQLQKACKFKLQEIDL